MSRESNIRDWPRIDSPKNKAKPYKNKVKELKAEEPIPIKKEMTYQTTRIFNLKRQQIINSHNEQIEIYEKQSEKLKNSSIGHLVKLRVIQEELRAIFDDLFIWTQQERNIEKQEILRALCKRCEAVIFNVKQKLYHHPVKKKGRLSHE